VLYPLSYGGVGGTWPNGRTKVLAHGPVSSPHHEGKSLDPRNRRTRGTGAGLSGFDYNTVALDAVTRAHLCTAVFNGLGRRRSTHGPQREPRRLTGVRNGREQRGRDLNGLCDHCLRRSDWSSALGSTLGGSERLLRHRHRSCGFSGWGFGRRDGKTYGGRAVRVTGAERPPRAVDCRLGRRRRPSTDGSRS
jgi:hypothetical protein